ncbi:DNA poymerase III subunit delta' [hydrothermal vent metagenome]|uniref:DNA poymerase III subunit delta n=1 Tax=hydrothermal vent metagenome TaxID=652676 RepID=A0A1W1BWC1_9ZZZZ
MQLISQVIITHYPQETILKLEKLVTNERVIKIVKEESFLVDDVKIAIEKAYLTSSVPVVIILSAKEFSKIIQNRLLKIIEEPPEGIIFILITHSKSTILPTIRSRIPIITLKETIQDEEFEIDMRALNLEIVYEFIKKYKRVNMQDAKVLVEKISIEAIKSNSFDLDFNTLKLFDNAYRVLNVGSSTQFVLMTLLIKLLAKKIR